MLRSADECVEALIKAGGNTALAAERMFGDDPNAIPSLIASIAQDPLAQESLNAQLRTLTTLRAFDALTQAQVLLPSILTDLEAADFVRFYTQLIKNVSDLATASATPAQPSDAISKLLEALPPEGRRAFMALVATGSDTTGGNAAPALRDGSAEPSTEAENAA